MIDIEERLRSELHELREGVELDLGLDPESIAGAGRRARTRRGVRRAVSGVAAVVAVGLVSYGVVPGRTLNAVPEPAQTSAAGQDGTASVRFELPHGVDDKYAELYMTVTRTGERLETTTAVLDQQGMMLFSVSGEQMIDHSSVGGTTLSLGAPVHIGVIPDRVQWLSPMADGGSRAITSDHRVLNSLGVTPYVLVFDKAVRTMSDSLVWQGVDGKVRQGPGSELPSTRLDFAGHRGVFYLAELWDHVGYHEDGGNGFGFSVSGATKALRMNYSGTVLRNGTMDVLGAGLLPSGSTVQDVELLDPTATWTSLALRDHTVIVVAGEASKLELVKSVTYLDAAGKRVTRQVENS